VSDAESRVKDVRILRDPRVDGDKRMECPECGRLLPIDNWTECDRCGAWLSLKIEVEVPA
jgi:hypothetical protein